MQPALLVLLFRRVKAPGSIPAPSSPEAEAAVPHL
jgi:hypothetical protein